MEDREEEVEGEEEENPQTTLRRQETRAEVELEQKEGEEEENCINFLLFDKIICDNFFFHSVDVLRCR